MAAGDVSGNDILSYRGNAALSSGSTTGTGFEDLNAAVLNEGTRTMLGNAFQAQVDFNNKRYAQAIKDRDDNYRLFAEQGVDFPVLDSDRPVLQSRIDEIKNLMIETPNIKANREAYTKLQSKVSELQAMKASAKTRRATAMTQQQAISQELNPDLKAKMQSSLEEQIKKGVTHDIDPYNQTITWDAKDLQNEKLVTSYTRRVGPDGIPYRTPVTVPDPKAYTDEVTVEGLTTGDKMQLPYKIKSFYDQQTQNGMLMNPDVVRQANTVIDNFNTENGFDKDNPYYAKHLAEIDGSTGKVGTNLTPVDFWKSYKVANTWKKATGTEEVDKDVQTGQKAQMEIKTGYQDANSRSTQASAAMKSANSTAQKVPAEINKLNADAKKALADGDKTTFETLKMKATGMQDASDAYQLYGNEALAKSGYRAISKLPAGQREAFQKVYASVLPGVGENWEIRDLGKRNATAVRALTTQSTDYPRDKDGNIIKNSSAIVKKYTPSQVFMLRSPDGDPNKQKLVGLDNKGNVIKVLDINQAGEELVKNSSGYKQDEKSIEVLASYNLARQTFQGSDAAGWDLSTSLNRTAVVDNTAEGRNIESVNLGGDELRVDSDRLIDPKTGRVVAIKRNGVWVNQQQ